VVACIKNKKDPTICCLQKFTSGIRTKIGWKWKDEQIYSVQMLSKREQEWPYLCGKKYTLIKIVIKDKEVHYIMIKWPIHQKEIKIINIYVPSTRAPKYIKQTLTEVKGERGNNTKIVGDSNTPLFF